MAEILTRFGHQLVAFAPKGVLGLGLFLLSWVAAALAARLLRRLGRGMGRERREILELAASTTKGTLILLGLVTALGTMGINVSALVAGLGLTGFALGFALRDALSNLLAGALIVIYRPFQINDRIAVTGFEGTVVEINLRYAVLQGEDRIYLVPNAILFTNAISVLNRPAA